MAKVLTDPKHYTDIANAIREKNGTSDTYTPADMASAILAIKSGGGGGSVPPADDATGLWVINAAPTSAFSGYVEASFYSNGTQYSKIAVGSSDVRFVSTGGTLQWVRNLSGVWSDVLYRAISVKTSPIPSTLYNWLVSNALYLG